MVIILDADVVIRGEKGLFDLRRWVGGRPSDQFAIAAVTVAELWHGVERATGQHKTKRLVYLQNFMASVPVISYTEAIAYEHARIWAALESSGKMMGFYDIIVAATAASRGDSVATFNRRHFDLIPSLNVIEPVNN